MGLGGYEKTGGAARSTERKTLKESFAPTVKQKVKKVNNRQDANNKIYA
jgi:hypothetical protein